jgi:hypothetical protein
MLLGAAATRLVIGRARTTAARVLRIQVFSLAVSVMPSS